jgi:hypothetical protein
VTDLTLELCVVISSLSEDPQIGHPLKSGTLLTVLVVDGRLLAMLDLL